RRQIHQAYDADTLRHAPQGRRLDAGDQVRRLSHATHCRGWPSPRIHAEWRRLTKRYHSIVEAAAALPVGGAIIDGEMVVQDESGVTDFQALRGAIDGEPH